MIHHQDCVSYWWTRFSLTWIPQTSETTGADEEPWTRLACARTPPQPIVSSETCQFFCFWIHFLSHPSSSCKWTDYPLSKNLFQTKPRKVFSQFWPKCQKVTNFAWKMGFFLTFVCSLLTLLCQRWELLR